MSKLRYFDASGQKKPNVPALETLHSDFLRTGRIIRHKDNWVPEERRYLSYQEVAERTGRRLEVAGQQAHDRLNSFHRSIQLPKMIFHRTLEDRPHLGYCHVTASKTRFAEFDEVKWAFYIANFMADIGEDEKMISNLRRRGSRMYFAVAMQPDDEKKKLTIDRKIRGNGVIFRTNDPKVALKNVLLLGARNEKLRDVIRSL
ncbi:hypothetical protein LJR030_001276 [Rhizobium sp. LjRoot30]|uniref:DUF6656 family protein n=1 Tax=Rhizobium sp. LjRoot30 TaxID=3342320 RepID=UPI003ECF1395